MLGFMGQDHSQWKSSRLIKMLLNFLRDRPSEGIFCFIELRLDSKTTFVCSVRDQLKIHFMADKWLRSPIDGDS